MPSAPLLLAPHHQVPKGSRRLPGLSCAKRSAEEGNTARIVLKAELIFSALAKKKKKRCGRKSNTSSPPPRASPWPHVRAHAEEGRGQLLALAAEGRRQQRGSELAGDGERGVSDFSPPGTSCSPDDR